MGEFDYNKLEKINVSKSFPKYRFPAVESCESNNGKKWKTNIVFFADENLIWATRPYFNKLGGRIYMGTRKNEKIVFKVIEAHKKWKNNLNWINGYSLDLRNKSIEDALNQTLKGKYASSGSYRRKCEIKFGNIIETKDTHDHLLDINFIERRQKETLEIMDKFGIRFAEKYDFEAVKLVVKNLNEKEKKLAKEKAKREAQEKARKLAEEKAKREAELKEKKLAEEKAKREAELKEKKLAEEKAKREAQEKARKLAKEKAKREAEKKAKKIAEEKAKREAELKEKKLAEEKAKREAQKKAKDEKFILKFSEKLYETDVTLRNEFDILEKMIKEKKVIKNEDELSKLNKAKSQLNKFYQKPIEDFSLIERREFAEYTVLYTLTLKKHLSEGIRTGIIPLKNDFNIALFKYKVNLNKKLVEIDNIINYITILKSFKNKFSKNEWPDDIDNFLDRNINLYNTTLNLINKMNSKNFWQEYIYPSNLHLKKIKLFEIEIVNWINQSSESFKQFYNKKLYDLSVQKNLNQIKEKQDKEEDFFNKIGY